MRLSPMADTCFPRFLLLKLVMYVAPCCSLFGGWSVRLLPGGGGALTYMSSTGMCRSKDPLFYTWPVLINKLKLGSHLGWVGGHFLPWRLGVDWAGLTSYHYICCASDHRRLHTHGSIYEWYFFIHYIYNSYRLESNPKSHNFDQYADIAGYQLFFDRCRQQILIATVRERPLDSQGGGAWFFLKKIFWLWFWQKKIFWPWPCVKKISWLHPLKKKCPPSIHEKKMSALYPWKENVCPLYIYMKIKCWPSINDIIMDRGQI